MIDAPTALKLVEDFAPGTWVAMSTADGSILASGLEHDQVYEQVKGWDNAVPPLFLKVPEPSDIWLL